MKIGHHVSRDLFYFLFCFIYLFYFIFIGSSVDVIAGTWYLSKIVIYIET